MSDQAKFVLLGRGGDPAQFIGRTASEHDALFTALAIADPVARGAAVQALVGAAKAPKARAEPLSAIHDRMARHAQFPTRNTGRGR